ncbi:MAG: hypothetical protein JWO69_1016 [Thermoleophilia bacterium]|nr:hypothetical protein [Thermoleophilia bacterium]
MTAIAKLLFSADAIAGIANSTVPNARAAAKAAARDAITKSPSGMQLFSGTATQEAVTSLFAADKPYGAKSRAEKAVKAYAAELVEVTAGVESLTAPQVYTAGADRVRLAPKAALAGIKDAAAGEKNLFQKLKWPALGVVVIGGGALWLFDPFGGSSSKPGTASKTSGAPATTGSEKPAAEGPPVEDAASLKKLKDGSSGPGSARAAIALSAIEEVEKNIFTTARGSKDLSAEVAAYIAASTGAPAAADRDWSGDFVAWAAAQGGVPIGVDGAGAADPAKLMAWARSADAVVKSSERAPQVGDIVVLRGSGDAPQVDSYGIVTAANDTAIIVVQGNVKVEGGSPVGQLVRSTIEVGDKRIKAVIDPATAKAPAAEPDRADSQTPPAEEAPSTQAPADGGIRDVGLVDLPSGVVPP